MALENQSPNSSALKDICSGVSSAPHLFFEIELSRAPQNRLDPLHVRRNIDPDALVIDLDYGNLDSVFKRAQLFKFLRAFQRKNRKTHEPQERIASIPVDAEMLQ